MVKKPNILFGLFFMDFRVFDNGLQELSEQLDLSQQRSFLYGDGHFTTAKVKNGHVEHLSLHLERLERAHKQLKFNPVLWNKLKNTIVDTASAYSLAVLKVQISRGQSVRGYGQALRASPAIFISISPLTEDTSNQLPAIDLNSVETALAQQPLLAGIKHCNRLEQVLIAHELDSKGEEDGLVSDTQGHLIETNKANIFWLQNDTWYTPSLNLSGVAGVQREFLLQKLAAQETLQCIDKIKENIRAAFICNSLMGIRAVAHFAGKTLDLAPVELLKQELLMKESHHG